jgi:hypothetical protein
MGAGHGHGAHAGSRHRWRLAVSFGLVAAVFVVELAVGLARGSLDAGTRVVTAEYVKGDPSQLWKIVPAADGYAYIENVKSGLVIACDGKNNGSAAHIEKKQDGDDGQLWKLNPVRNMKGSVVFVRKGTDRVLAITQGSKNAGVGIILWDDSTNNGPEHGYTLAPPK